MMIMNKIELLLFAKTWRQSIAVIHEFSGYGATWITLYLGLLTSPHPNA